MPVIPADKALFRAINHWPDSLSEYMRFLSEATNIPWVKAVLILFVIALIAAGKETRRCGIQLLLAFPLANLLTDIFKKTLPMPRPFNDPGLDGWILRLGASDSAGTASAHSANMMAVAVIFLIHFRWFGIPWFILAILVGISRIYNGVHYPGQVLLGWICGAFMALAVHLTWEFVRKKLSKEPDSTDAPKPADEAQLVPQ